MRRKTLLAATLIALAPLAGAFSHPDCPRPPGGGFSLFRARRHHARIPHDLGVRGPGHCRPAAGEQRGAVRRSELAADPAGGAGVWGNFRLDTVGQALAVYLAVMHGIHRRIDDVG